MDHGRQRRTYGLEFKLRAVERMRAGEGPGALARELGIRRKFLYAWKEAVESGRGFPGSGHPVPPDKRTPSSGTGAVRDGAERVKELEALVGRLTLENRFFKGALQSIAELRRARSASSSEASSPKSKR